MRNIENVEKHGDDGTMERKNFEEEKCLRNAIVE